MVLRVFHDATAFRARVAPVLAAREAENNLLFGMTHVIERERHPMVFLGSVETGDTVRGAVMMTPPQNLVLSTMAPGDAEAVAQALDPALAPPGAFGLAEVVGAFARRWGSRAAVHPEHALAQRLYRLTEVRWNGAVAGRFRYATADDGGWIKPWLRSFHQEALGEPQQDAAADRQFRRFIDDPECCMGVWEDRGEPVAVAGSGGPTPNGVRVGPVYTTPERRGRGYATALVAALSRRRLAEGRRFCFLFTDLANPTANAIYQRIGYEPVCDFDAYRFAPAGSRRSADPGGGSPIIPVT